MRVLPLIVGAGMFEVFVRKLDALGPLDDDAKALIASLNLQDKQVEPRQDIISEGDIPGDVHLITGGLAYRYKILVDGRRQIVALMLPGDICNLYGFVL